LLVDVLNLDQPSVGGGIIGRGRKVPLLVTSEIDNVSLSDRIAIVKTIIAGQTLPFFALKVSGIPHSIYVGEEMMSDERDKKLTMVAARWVRVGNLSCIIPDFPKIERYIQEKG
jgi:hypothetical protein